MQMIQSCLQLYYTTKQGPSELKWIHSIKSGAESLIFVWFTQAIVFFYITEKN